MSDDPVGKAKKEQKDDDKKSSKNNNNKSDSEKKADRPLSAADLQFGGLSDEDDAGLATVAIWPRSCGNVLDDASSADLWAGAHGFVRVAESFYESEEGLSLDEIRETLLELGLIENSDFA